MELKNGGCKRESNCGVKDEKEEIKSPNTKDTKNGHENGSSEKVKEEEQEKFKPKPEESSDIKNGSENGSLEKVTKVEEDSNPKLEEGCHEDN